MTTALLPSCGAGPHGGVPPWNAPAAPAMLSLFPLTLVCVNVAHRALDVRVVIRQGNRYAVAGDGAQVPRVPLISGILLAISAAASRPNTRQVDILGVLGQGGIVVVRVRAGDLLVGRTHGISEALNHQEEEWGRGG